MEVKSSPVEVKKTLEATCPDCRGPLSVSVYGGLREYSCLVGHRYSGRGLMQAHSEAQEKALWSAVVALEETVNLVREVAGNFPDAVAARLQGQVAKKLEQAAAIRSILQELESFETALE